MNQNTPPVKTFLEHLRVAPIAQYENKAVLKTLSSDKFDEFDEFLKQCYMDYANATETNQVYVMGKGFSLNASRLFIPSDDIVLPQQKTIDDIIIVNSSLLYKVYKNPSLIHNLSSRQFEETVCELFEKQGYTVSLTQATRDGGKDVIVIKNSILGSFLIYVECKKYNPNRPIGVHLVRELFGTVVADKATAGVLITSSYFSREAVTFQEKIEHQMSLIDYVKLVKLIYESFQKPL